MNLSFLGYGMAGVFEAGLIALIVGLVVFALVHGLLWRRMHWSDAHEIAWSWLLAVAIGAGADTWQLFHMSVIPLQSPVTIRRILAGIHDPDYLSTRVFMEIAAVSLGVMLGWWLTRMRRARGGASDQDRE